MGMAAPQSSFLRLTARKHDIGIELQHCSVQKNALTRDMNQVSKDYNLALSAKTLKWSNNSGVTYQDLSYSLFMNPRNINQKQLYLITDQDGKIVLDDKYSKYAELISPKGEGGVEWKNNPNRPAILAELAGVSVDQINAYGNGVASFYNDANLDVAQLRQQISALDEQANNMRTFKSISDLLCNTEKAKDLYNSPVGSVTCSSASEVMAMLGEALSEVYNVMEQDGMLPESELFSQSQSLIMQDYMRIGEGSDSILPFGISYTNGSYSVNVRGIIDSIFGMYYEKLNAKLGEQCDNYAKSVNNVFYFASVPPEKLAEYNANRAQRAKLQAQIDQAQGQNFEIIDQINQVFSAEEESKVKYYDRMFSVIAEKGWVVNYQINDNDYLNQMLQNNQFYIMTVEDGTDEDGNPNFRYDIGIASDMDNLYEVNDTEAQNEAMVEYEYKKGVIKEKEARIDTRMKNLEIEQSAINKMLESTKKIINDNIEKLNVFT